MLKKIFGQKKKGKEVSTVDINALTLELLNKNQKMLNGLRA